MSSETSGIDDERHRRLMEQYKEIAFLAGGLAHEIKNPLSTIRLNLSLLAEDFDEAESVREQRTLKKIRVLERESQRLNDILESFLRFVHVHELRFKKCDLNEVVSEVIDFVTPETSRLGIELVPYFGHIQPVALDRELFKQALLNLILNAENALPNGGQIVLQTHNTEGGVQLDVIDNGLGMDDETQTKVFRPFYSTRKNGSGLGLPTARKTIEAHNGTVRVESEIDRGTRFIVTLPAAENEQGSDDSQSTN